MELRGSAGELLRGAVTPYIQNLSESQFPCHDDMEVLDLWKIIIDDNLIHKDSVVQERAISAVPAFVNEYYKGENLDNLISHFTSQLDQSELHLRGFSLALGSLPRNVLEGRLEQLLPILIDKTKIEKKSELWAEGRRDAIKAIVNIIKTVDPKSNGIAETAVIRIYECFLKALEDYTHDRRGDVGAWVREAAMTGLCALTLALAEEDPDLVPEVCLNSMMPKIAQQACEKIDRTRGHATFIFATLATSPKIPNIPCKSEVVSCFPTKIQKQGSDFDEFGWAVESETFPIFAKMIHLKPYTESILLGFVISVGGVTERLVRQSSLSLFKELENMNQLQLEDFGNVFLKIFQDYQKNDRVTLPLLKCLDQILTSGWLQPILSQDFSYQVFVLAKNEITKCGEPNKLVSSIDVFCNLLQCENPATISKCLVQLSIFLCHKFPRIRKVTAAKMFETLLVYDSVITDETKKDEINNILSDTNWDLSVEELRPIRNQLCELAGVQPPALIKKPL